MAWLDMEMERPGKTEYYLMAVAREIRQIFADRAIPLDDMRLKYETKKVEQKIPIEAETALAKGKWLGAFGIDPKILKQEKNKG